ncbi:MULTISPECIES: helix-turn-helix domain-containing protein [unclassified Bradyrhizobium]|uniref:AraC-like ligand-binding domain-containing protein n=1 Tax=unclassified Bradyrhizobium TaxID=2631580 RepID=UPI002478DB4E|nr:MULTISPECIES: helix-turn-helix domain-containing protein [unclassified Bradyrhizobium]WGS23586.1 helix-turn-helix domain-containing protein [Bradyrhizobium sp. ISRA463]WGS30610.1 helix-turn-helix domain-containing protein [Bradyrhizobium sp. ISRA464]
MPALFTTEDAPTHRRLALWQDIVCDVFVQLDCKSDLGTAFHGAITSSQVGPAKCSTVSSSQQRVLRTPSRIARATEDFVLFALGRRGAGAVLQDGRETVIQPGEFAFYDTTRPYELRFDDDFTQTIFQVPRAMLHRRFAGTEPLTATTFTPDRPVERLASQFIAGLSEVADRLDDDTAIRLADQAVDLLAMAMSERLGRATLTSSTHRSGLLYRLKAHVLAHLPNPDLGLAETAAALGISPRYINSLFADEDTSFQRFVLAQRLERCKRDLASLTHAHRHISEIAFAWGFNDLSHFGRVFREHYGMSPRDWRQSRLPN